MALTNRYVRADAAGGGNGTTNAASGANCSWTWAEMLTAAITAGGYKINIVGSSGTFTIGTAGIETLVSGVATAPNVYRGCDVAADDLESAGRSAGRLVTTIFPYINYTHNSGYLQMGSYNELEHLRIEGVRNASATGQVAGGTAGLIRRCKIVNKATSGGSAVAVALATTGTELLDCDVKASSPGGPDCVNVDRGRVNDCLIESTGPGVAIGTYGVVDNCRFANCYQGVYVGGANVFATISNCSFYKSTIADIAPSNAGQVTVINCLSWGNGGTTKFYACGSVQAHHKSNNTTGNHGAADTSPGDWPEYHRSTSLAADPFTDATNGDFTLTTAGKTAVAGLSITPHSDLGAVQHQDSGGSGGTKAFVFGY